MMKKEQYSKVYISDKKDIFRAEPSIWIFMDERHELWEWLNAEFAGLNSIVWIDEPIEDIQEKMKGSPDIVIGVLTLIVKSATVVAGLLEEGASNGYLPQIIFIPDAIPENEGGVPATELLQQDLAVIIRSLVAVRKNIGKTRKDNEAILGSLDNVKFSDTTGTLFIDRLKEIIISQIDNPNLSVEEICKEMRMSQSALYRKLKVYTGLSLIPFIRDIRLQKAKILLSETVMTLSEIAFAVGFNDAKFFGKVFFQLYNVRAVDFRKGKLGAGLS